LAAANSVCKSNLTAPTPFDLTVVITDISAGSIFDRKVHITGSGIDQNLLIKDDADFTRILTTEANSDSGYPYLNRYFIKYDKATTIATFEGLERGYPTSTSTSGGYYFYRVYTNDSNQEVRILAQNGGVSYSASAPTTGALDASTMVGGAGNFGLQNATMAFLVRDSSAATSLDAIGCVDMSAATVGGTGACASYPITDVTSGGAADTLINTTAFGTVESAWTRDETISDLSFDDSSIFTAAPAN
jgi:hypothetical protein